MKYNLIGNNNYLFPLDTVLENRGINNIQEFLSAGENPNVVSHYSTLKNIDEAVGCLLKHIDNKNSIFVQVDSDSDGMTSASMLINYLNCAFSNLNIIWRQHKGKEHGIKSEHVPDGVNLVITPDSASNDFTTHEKLKKRGIDTIVLDHHEVERESQDAIVVNNQLNKLSNPNLTGAGVVYKFLQALDDKLNLNHANDYLDLLAVGQVADMCSMADHEIRYYVAQGLKQINNPLLKELFKAQEYSTKGKKNATVISFQIAPYFNAVIRMGTMEEKEQLFETLLSNGTETVYYERGKKEEPLCVNTVRMMNRVRTQQNKARDEAVALIEERIREKNLLDNKILIVNATDLLDKNLSGLVASRLANSNDIKRPVLLLRFNERNNLSGSARGYEKGQIQDFKKFLEDTGKFIYLRGHANAFGIEIAASDLVEVNNIINEQLKDVEILTSVYDVDFIIPSNQLDKRLIETIDGAKDLWGKNVEEPLLAIENVEIEKRNIQLIGKNENVIKFTCNGIEYIKFGSSKNEWQSLVEFGNGGRHNSILINIIAKCGINEFRGKKTPQLLIEDYEIIKEKEIKLAF